jgi:hypothetical protein
LSFSIGSLEGKTLDQYVNKNIETSLANYMTLVKSLTDITVGDLKGKTYRISSLGEHTYLYFSPKPDKFFLITNSTNDPANQGYLKIADQIISSVRFN